MLKLISVLSAYMPNAYHLNLFDGLFAGSISKSKYIFFIVEMTCHVATYNLEKVS